MFHKCKKKAKQRNKFNTFKILRASLFKKVWHDFLDILLFET